MVRLSQKTKLLAESTRTSYCYLVGHAFSMQPASVKIILTMHVLQGKLIINYLFLPYELQTNQ